MSDALPPIPGLSTAEAARILGVHQNSVNRYVARGLLHRPAGRTWHSLDRDEVEQLALARWQPVHPYWAPTSEVAGLLGISDTRVKRPARGSVTCRSSRRPLVFCRHELEVIANAREARLLS